MLREMPFGDARQLKPTPCVEPLCWGFQRCAALIRVPALCASWVGLAVVGGWERGWG